MCLVVGLHECVCQCVYTHTMCKGVGACTCYFMYRCICVCMVVGLCNTVLACAYVYACIVACLHVCGHAQIVFCCLCTQILPVGGIKEKTLAVSDW